LLACESTLFDDAMGAETKNFNEVYGQIIRPIGSVALTKLKGVPIGNTGGSNVSPVKVMPIIAEYAELISKARSGV
jgi:hypothetical protein